MEDIEMEGGQLIMEGGQLIMEGGHLINKTEAISLTNKVNFEIGSHRRANLNHNEIWYHYWYGYPFKTKGYAYFIKEGISRL